MKTLTKLLSAAAIAAGSLGVTAVASADVSYNVGYVSEYYYRGIYQKNSSASAGIDYEEGGFYVGAWTADVGDGLEYDLYGCLLYTSPSPRDGLLSRMPSSA